jgi:cyanophycin synthetase
MIVVKHGRRSMQLAWTHLLPATFGGRAMMNVQNAMAAAAAAFAAGAPLHDIRQGLRTFARRTTCPPAGSTSSTSTARTVIVDYCHNAPAMRMLGDFVDRLGDEPAPPRELGPAVPDRRRRHRRRPRDDDMRELGEIAAAHFDVVIIREDARCAVVSAASRRADRGPASGRDGESARCRQVDICWTS